MSRNKSNLKLRGRNLYDGRAVRSAHHIRRDSNLGSPLRAVFHIHADTDIGRDDSPDVIFQQPRNSGIELRVEGGAKPLAAGASYVVVGVVASSNLEVLAERKDLGGKCRFEVATTAANFSETWKAVFIDFMDRSKPRDVLFSINDFSAIPPVVSLRLDQALEQLTHS